MKQFCLTCMFLCVHFFTRAQFATATQFFQEGKFQLAAVNYEQCFFEDLDKDSAFYFLFQKAQCYKQLYDFKKAAETLSRIDFVENDSLQEVLLKDQILLHLLSDHFTESYNQILKYKLRGYKVDSLLITYEVIDLIALDQWQEARGVLLKNKEILRLNEEMINHLISTKLKPKDPDKAYNLSFFLPGVGQMYAGYPFKGILSGGIQTVFVGFSIYSLWKGYFFTGAMTGVAAFYTFYFGGARYASALAERHNVEVSAEINKNFIDYLETKKALE